MDLTNLQNRLVEWLKGGPEDDVVLSSRVRLARNIDGYGFVGRASDRQKARIEELLRNVLLSLDICPPLNYVRLDRLSELQREFLTERHLITSRNAEADWVRGVAFDDAEQASVVINDEDHLRIQVIRAGLELHEAARRADELDDMIARRVPFAFSPHYGYLTAGPSNVGTGMRASVMLHLPGIVMSREMDRVLDLVRSRRIRLRGVYGEGSHGSGDAYEVSNIATLGPTEEELVETVADTALKLVEAERAARLNLYDSHSEEFIGQIDRAMSLLHSAATITSQEALHFLSQVRMGVEMKVVGGPPLEVVNDLFLLTLPAHLQTMEGRAMDTSVRNRLRASYVKDRLAGY